MHLLETGRKLKCPSGVHYILEQKLQRDDQERLITDPPRILFTSLYSFSSSSEPTIISSLAFNSSGTNFATGGINKKIKLYNWASCLKAQVTRPGPVSNEIENCSKVNTYIVIQIHK